MTLSLRDRDDSISAQLTVGFGVVATVAVALSITLLLLLLRVGSALEEVRADGRSVRDALSLSLSIREHYLHEAHTLIHRDDHQVAHHARWLETLQERARELRARVPASERAHLDTLMRESAALDRGFREDVLPAALADDQPRMREAHDAAGAHTGRATEAADAVVVSLEARMERARRRAQEATTLAVVVGSVGAVAVLLLAGLFSLRLRRAIVRPLSELASAARRFGRGEFEPLVGDVGDGEMRVVARSFDTMARALKERERALLKSERLAAVGQLAAGVAHEINNPVAVIRGYLTTMIPEARDEEQREELHILDQEAAACQRIVEDLLAHGRDPGLLRERMDAEELLGEVAGRFSSTDVGADVEVRCDAEKGKLLVDALRMRQVVDNLLSNAAHHSEPGATVELTGRLLEDGGYRIEVADRGPGIPDEERERVFEPFRTGRRDGTGLGLAVCRVIVRAHGGAIRALPRPDGGTVMRVELPPPEETS